MKAKLAAVIMAVAMLSACASENKTAKDIAATVQLGDEVSLKYTARFLETGEVFDTSEEAVAKNASVPKVANFKPRANYAPLKIPVGEGVISGAFDSALLGMRVGEEKDILLPPGDAFGYRNESLVKWLPRVLRVPRAEEISREDFELSYGKLELNETLEMYHWRARVVNLTNDTMTILHEARNESIDAEGGTTKITVNEAFVTVEFVPKINLTFKSKAGDYVTILAANESHMLADYNHPYAGKSVVFHVRVEKIEKK